METNAEVMLDPQLLSLLACPESHQRLRLADATLLAQVNERIAAGTQRRHDGALLEQPLRAGLVRDDGSCLYPVEDGIPNLLIGDRIDL